MEGFLYSNNTGILKKFITVKKEKKKRSLVFDQKTPVHPVSESRGGITSVTNTHTQNQHKFLCLIWDVPDLESLGEGMGTSVPPHLTNFHLQCRSYTTSNYSSLIPE